MVEIDIFKTSESDCEKDLLHICSHRSQKLIGKSSIKVKITDSGNLVS